MFLTVVLKRSVLFMLVFVLALTPGCQDRRSAHNTYENDPGAVFGTSDQMKERSDGNTNGSSANQSSDWYARSEQGPQIDRDQLSTAREESRKLKKKLEKNEPEWPEKFDRQARKRLRKHMKKRGWSDFSTGRETSGDRREEEGDNSETDR